MEVDILKYWIKSKTASHNCPFITFVGLFEFFFFIFSRGERKRVDVVLLQIAISLKESCTCLYSVELLWHMCERLMTFENNEDQGPSSSSPYRQKPCQTKWNCWTFLKLRNQSWNYDVTDGSHSPLCSPLPSSLVRAPVLTVRRDPPAHSNDGIQGKLFNLIEFYCKSNLCGIKFR